MTSFDEQMEELYGPLVRYSDHKRGEQVTYLDEQGQKRTGKILWIAGPTTIARKHVPLHYIVEPDHREGFPDSVAPGAIIGGPNEAEEPTMVRCPYCGGLHYARLVAQCPNNPDRER